MEQFRELFVLLRGSSRSGQLAAQAIVDTLLELLRTGDAAEVPLDQVLHELCTDLLMAPEWTTRTNAAAALRLICSEFQRTLKPRLLESKSDGDLLYLDELDVGKIYNCGYSTELLGGHSTYVEDAKTDNKLYGKKWLKRQRKALQKRLGLELGGDAEVTMGLGYVAKGDEGVVEDEDISTSTAASAAAASRKPARIVLRQEGALLADTRNSNDDGGGEQDDSPTSETAFARLVRFLVIGLLDSQWEARHGCAVGLSGIINGLTSTEVVRDFHTNDRGTAAQSLALYKDDAAPADGEPLVLRQQDHEKELEQEERQDAVLPLPPHLLDDIVCTGVCVLILDRFIDFSTAASVVSPVKEAVGQLVALAARCLSSSAAVAAASERERRGGDKALRVLQISKEMASRAQDHWSIRLGGLILLKYLLPTQPTLRRSLVAAGSNAAAMVVVDDEEDDKEQELRATVRLLCACLGDVIDDVRGAAAAGIHALQLALSNPTSTVGPSELSECSPLFQALLVAARDLNDMSTAALDYCLALRALSSLVLRVGRARLPLSGNDFSQQAGFVMQCMELQSVLMASAHLYSYAKIALLRLPLQIAAVNVNEALVILCKRRAEATANDAWLLLQAAAEHWTASLLSLATQSSAPGGVGSCVLVGRDDSGDGSSRDDAAGESSLSPEMAVASAASLVLCFELCSAFEWRREVAAPEANVRLGTRLQDHQLLLTSEEQAMCGACEGPKGSPLLLLRLLLRQRAPSHTTSVPISSASSSSYASAPVKAPSRAQRAAAKEASSIELSAPVPAPVAAPAAAATGEAAGGTGGVAQWGWASSVLAVGKKTIAAFGPAQRGVGNPHSCSSAEEAGRALFAECCPLRLSCAAGGMAFASALSSLPATDGNEEENGESEVLNTMVALWRLLGSELTSALAALQQYRLAQSRAAAKPAVRLVLVVGGEKDDHADKRRRGAASSSSSSSSSSATSLARSLGQGRGPGEVVELDRFPAVGAAERCCQGAAASLLLVLGRPAASPGLLAEFKRQTGASACILSWQQLAAVATADSGAKGAASSLSSSTATNSSTSSEALPLLLAACSVVLDSSALQLLPLLAQAAHLDRPSTLATHHGSSSLTTVPQLLAHVCTLLLAPTLREAVSEFELPILHSWLAAPPLAVAFPASFAMAVDRDEGVLAAQACLESLLVMLASSAAQRRGAARAVLGAAARAGQAQGLLAFALQGLEPRLRAGLPYSSSSSSSSSSSLSAAAAADGVEACMTLLRTVEIACSDGGDGDRAALVERGIVSLVARMVFAAARAAAGNASLQAVVADLTEVVTLSIAALCSHSSASSSSPQRQPLLAELCVHLKRHLAGNDGGRGPSTGSSSSSSNGGGGSAIAHLSLLLCRRLPLPVLLGSFEAVLDLALLGLGSPEEAVRTGFVACFRVLVPLAALVRAEPGAFSASSSLQSGSSGSSSGSTSGSSSGSGGGGGLSVTRHILARTSPPRITLSLDPLDVEVLRRLQAFSLVAVPSTGPGAGTKAGRLALRDYQWDGISWLTFLRRTALCGVLADEMGLGKSVQALVALALMYIEQAVQAEASTPASPSSPSHHQPQPQHHQQHQGTQRLWLPSLLVCPASLRSHWFNETNKFFAQTTATANRRDQGQPSSSSSSPAPLLRAALYDRADAPPAPSATPLLLIVSYEGLRSSPALQQHHWAAVILDEAHFVRNPNTALAKAVYAVGGRAKWRLCLTGTPVMNHVEELWSLMNFLLPGYLGDFPTFRATVSRVIKKAARLDLSAAAKPSSDSAPTASASSSAPAAPAAAGSTASLHAQITVSTDGLVALRRLHKQVLPLILRRLKTSVAKELPPKTIVDVACPLSALQKEMYVDFQRGLRITDHDLERQVACLRANISPAAAAAASASGPSGRPIGAQEPALHPLKALLFLKLLCVHPALVTSTSHAAYRQRLLLDPTSSGKMAALARLLVDCGVVAAGERVGEEEEERGEEGRERDGDSDSDADEEDDDEDDDDEEEEQQKQKQKQKQSRKPSLPAPAPAAATAPIDDGCEEVEEEDENGEVIIRTVARPQPQPQPQPQGRGKRPLEAAEPDPSSSRRSSRHAAGAADSSSSSKGKGKGKGSAPAPVSVPGSGPGQGQVRNLGQGAGEAAAKHRCLIFATHRATLDVIERCVLRRFFPTVPYARLDGNMPAAQRSALAERFNAQQQGTAPPSLAQAQAQAQGQELRMLLVTTKACGVGLTLTAADTVIFVEHDWNPFVDLQAMDRAHRIGQTMPVTVYRLLAEATIEARILGLQDHKFDVVSELINEDNDGATAAAGGAQWGEKVWAGMSAAIAAPDQEQASQGQGKGQGQGQGQGQGLEEDEYDALSVEAFLSSIGAA